MEISSISITCAHNGGDGMYLEENVRPQIRAMMRPKHGGDVWGKGSVLDYSSNVNPLGHPERLNEYIEKASQELINYPDDSALIIKEAIAERYDVGVNNVIVGAGSAEIIRLFPEVFVSPGDKVLMPHPTFSEYSFGCRLMGAEIIDASLPEENDFRPDIGSIINLLDNTKAVYFCNPNNPTGKIAARKEVLELVSEAERKNTMVFLDETLLELSSKDKDVSCVGSIDSHQNLFIIRSFTKSFAMPGLRIGYGFGNEDLIRYMNTGRLTWNLGTIEQRVGSMLIREEQEHVRKAVDLLDSEKIRMYSEMIRIFPYAVPDTDSYFFFCPLYKLGVKSPEFRKAMLERGILVRDCSSFGSPCENYSRFCVKTPEMNDVFLKSLKETIESLRGC